MSPGAFAIDIATLVFAACSAFFAGWQILLSRRQNRREYDWRRRQRVCGASVFKNPEYPAARGRLKAAGGNLVSRVKPILPEQVRSAKARDSELVAAMLLVLSHGGRLATEIKLRLIDEDVAYRVHGSMFTSAYFGLKECVEEPDRKKPQGNPDPAAFATRWLGRRQAPQSADLGDAGEIEEAAV